MKQLEFEYIRENHKSYMVLKNNLIYENEAEKMQFGIRMLSDNNLREILPVSLKCLNGEDHVYYDISSKQPLNLIYEKRLFYKTDLIKIFDCIYQTIDKMEAYFLDMEDLVLQPDFIFCEGGTNQICFMYYPGNRNDFIEQSFTFSEYILDHICNEDEATVIYAYSFYRLLKEESGDIKLAISKMKSIKENIEMNQYENSKKDNNDNNEKIMTKQYEIEEEPFYLDEKMDSGITTKKSEEKNKFIPEIVLLLFGIGLIIYGFYLYGFQFEYLYSKMEYLIGISFFIVSVAMCIYKIVSKKIYYKNKKEETVKENQENLFFEDCSIMSEEVQEDTAYIDNQEEVSFETVLISDKCYVEKRMLVGKVKGKKKTIDLSTFPFLIGKNSESVDFVIDDATVSRSHARFSLKDEIVYVTDLNSSNGTKINGIRLQPNEMVALEAEDEIDFGRVAFTYY